MTFSKTPFFCCGARPGRQAGEWRGKCGGGGNSCAWKFWRAVAIAAGCAAWRVERRGRNGKSGHMLPNWETAAGANRRWRRAAETGGGNCVWCRVLRPIRAIRKIRHGRSTRIQEMAAKQWAAKQRTAVDSKAHNNRSNRSNRNRTIINTYGIWVQNWLWPLGTGRMYDTVTQRRSPLKELEKADSERENKHRKHKQKTGTAELKPKSGKRSRQPVHHLIEYAGCRMTNAGWQMRLTNCPSLKCADARRAERAERDSDAPWRTLAQADGGWRPMGWTERTGWAVQMDRVYFSRREWITGTITGTDASQRPYDASQGQPRSAHSSPDQPSPAQISPVQARPYPTPCLHPCVSARTIEAQAQLAGVTLCSLWYHIILYHIILIDRLID